MTVMLFHNAATKLHGKREQMCCNLVLPCAQLKQPLKHVVEIRKIKHFDKSLRIRARNFDRYGRQCDQFFGIGDQIITSGRQIGD